MELVWCASFYVTAFMFLTSTTPVRGVNELSYTIREEEEAGYVVGTVSVDADLGHGSDLPSDVGFQLLPRSKYFSIHQRMSTITTVRRLDREELCPDSNEPCVLTIDVMVTPTESWRIIKIHITIEDVNDNSPMFLKPIHDILVPESLPVNTTLYLPMADDQDSDKFGVEYYELEANTQAFKITETTDVYGNADLLLVLVQPLDRERRGSYTLRLVARDRGRPSRSGMMILNVTVGDDNDNIPVFQQPLYNVRVPESAKPGIMLTRVKATDRDVGPNGRVRYSINPRTTRKIKSTFRLDEITGELFLMRRLDYEQDKSFLLPILAFNSPNVPENGRAIINVSVSDENDNYPVITVTTITSRAQVAERSPNGTFAAHIRVEDADSGPNGLITCVISSPQFLLQPSYYDNEYDLVVNDVLDRELHARLNVTIYCTDSGSPPKTGKASVLVYIVDINDNKPMFDRFVYYALPILENNELGLPVTQVKAMDKDSDVNAELTYSLGADKDAALFSIDKLTGVVTATTVLDREKQKDYTFSVIATDKGTPPLTATAAVYVRLADVNDNYPDFNISYYRMSVAENMPKYSFVGKVTATDHDEGSNGDVWYKMVNASAGPFIIAHDTGIISTRSPLDREKVGGSQYQVTVIATDYGTPSLSSAIKITIDVIDENDHKPIITSSENQTIKCSFETPVNTTIGHVIAFDPDYGENGQLGYFIQSGNKDKMFAIGKRTGDIIVAKSIDPSLTGFHKLEIGVHDNGQPPFTVFTNVYLKITKEPYVSPEYLSGDISEHESAPMTYNVNLIVVVVLSSMSGVLSLILIVAIVRIKRQTKENHTYNCRTEAQKLFANINGRSDGRPSCGSSWVGTDRNSVLSRDSMICSETHISEQQPMNGQSFLTTFASNNNHHLMANADDCSRAKVANQFDSYTNDKCNIMKEMNLHSGDGETDSGNCEDGCSIHNSTPMHLAHSNNLANRTAPNSLQAFQYRFLATGRGEGVDSKGPSSISSGNNSLTSCSSKHTSSSNCINQNSIHNQKQMSVDGTIVSGYDSSKVSLPRLPNDHPPKPGVHNSSGISSQTVNGEQLCEKIDEVFFSQIL